MVCREANNLKYLFSGGVNALMQRKTRVDAGLDMISFYKFWKLVQLSVITIIPLD
jgi:hypothetical protein